MVHVWPFEEVDTSSTLTSPNFHVYTMILKVETKNLCKLQFVDGWYETLSNPIQRPRIAGGVGSVRY